MKKRLFISGILGIVSAIVYFASMANYAFPGESAHLQALWRGLDTAANPAYPLMAFFARLLGSGNLIAPICGVISVVAIYNLISFMVSQRIHGEHTQLHAEKISNIAGGVAAIVFMLTPAVRESATHLEPRLFDMMWAMIAFLWLIPFVKLQGGLSLLSPMAIGAMAALGFCDSALFVAFGPLYVGAIIGLSIGRGRKPYLPVFLFIVSALVVFLVAVKGFGLDLGPFLEGISKELSGYYTTPGWLFVAVFSTLPFVTAIFSTNKAYNETPGLVQWLFHCSMTFVGIIAISTPLSPSASMETYGILPVATSAFAASVAGYIVSYWWIHRRKPIGMVAGGIFVLVISITCVWNLFAFDRNHGAFADQVARKVIEDLGNRKWFVTDGTLDDHLRLAAADAGKEVNLIQLSRDLDENYLNALGKLVREKGICGSKSDSLALSLSLGVLPFVQDWFASDPSVVDEVAIYGAPDLWYSAGLKPVPEFLFFGADPKRVPDWNVWKEYDALLTAPKGWGSYRSRKVDNPVDRMRFAIRRHLGLVANDRGVYLQDSGKNDEAFAMYELVLKGIDGDNVCALFNEIEMMNAGFAKAKAKKNELNNELKKIVEDKDRRYYIWRLGNYYGYIRNPDMFIRLGFAWARSGRPGDALQQIKRAIDFVPTDKRAVLLNMMAALYAHESDHVKSRHIYEEVLAKNSNDHDALIGMMRLELLDGNSTKALRYLEKAAANSGDGKRAKMELAMVSMMKNDFAKAKELLSKITDADPKDMQAWSLTAAVTMQQCDAAKDDKVKAALTKELESAILPMMEKNASGPFDYYVQTTKAFLLMRQGEGKRREARDAFAAAAKARPDIMATQDLVLGLDISLDDPVEAERHAKDILRRNRNAPLANYVMGSLALRKDDYQSAEMFLHKAADARKPVVLALNDLAEVLRRNKNYVEAERYARKATELAPQLYVAWETLGSVLMDAKRNLDEAEMCVKKACDLSKGKNGREEDVRMLVSLARIQIMNGDKQRGRGTIRKVQSRVSELSDFERKEFEELKKSAR